MTRAIWFLSAVLCLHSLAAAEPKPLTGEQRKTLQSLLSDFRKYRADIDKRLEVVDKAADIDPRAVKAVQDLVTQELGSQLTAYRGLFTKAAVGLIGKKADNEHLAEIQQLREKTLELGKSEALTKDQVISQSTPALERLKKLILIDREDVLATSADLRKRRELLLTLGKVWERCREHTAKEDAAEAKPAGEDASQAPPVSFEKYLAGDEEAAAGMALPMSPQTRQVFAANASLAEKIDPEEARCVSDLNLTRTLLGLSPVQIDLALAAAARGHSADMLKHKFFSHDSPLEGKKTPWDRAKLANTSASAENIAYGTRDGSVANRMWWESPGHHRNMLGDHTRVGLGRAEGHWTELFGR